MKEILENFKNVSVLIVGDVMLDQYLYGSSERISPEAPVPVVRLREKKFIAGGAANVAANVKSLGGRPILVGVTGNGENGRIFAETLRAEGINGDFLVRSRERMTTVKTRVIAERQQIARVDQESVGELSDMLEEKVWKNIQKGIDQADILLISDYGKGVITANIISRLITLAKRQNKKILIDPKGKDYQKYKNASIITPNKKESENALEFFSKRNGSEITVPKLLKRLNLEAILVTEGEKGMTLFEKNKSYKLKARTRKVFDVTGAGDTVIAALAVALGAGAKYKDAAFISNMAAGLVVEEVGTSVAEYDDLYGIVLES